MRRIAALTVNPFVVAVVMAIALVVELSRVVVATRVTPAIGVFARVERGAGGSAVGVSPIV